MSAFALDPALTRSATPIGDLPLCAVLARREAAYPWLLLVPRVAGAVEIADLDEADAGRLIAEIRLATGALRQAFAPTKINVGAIGNKVRQLHVHVVARFETDPAWPGVVWDHASGADRLDDAGFAARRGLILEAFAALRAPLA